MAGIFVTIGGSSSPLKRELASALAYAKHAAREISAHINSTGAKVVGSVLSEEAIRRTIEYASKVGDTAKRLGISTDAVQEFDYALKQSGSSIENVIPFFEKLAVTRDKALGGGAGGDDAIEAFKKLGVSIDDLKNNRLEDITRRIGDVFKAGDAQKLIGALREVGGKGAGEFAAAMKEGLREAGDAAKELGLIIDKETIDKLKDAGDRFKQIGSRLMTALAPVVAWLGDAFTAILDQVERIGAFLGGLSAGGIKGGRAAVAEFNASVVARETAKLKHLQEVSKNLTGGGDGGDSSGGGKTKSASAIDQSILRRIEIMDRLREISSLTADEVERLEDELKKLDVKQASGEKNKLLVERAQLVKELLEVTKYSKSEMASKGQRLQAIDQQLKTITTNKESNKESNAAGKSAAGAALTEWERAGGLMGGATLIDVNQKQLAVLKVIAERVKNQRDVTAARRVNYGGNR